MIENDIYTILSGVAGGRVYPLLIPEKSPLPAISYSRIGTTPSRNMSGATTIDQVRIQVDTYADTYAQAKSVGASVRSLLENSSAKAILQSELDFYESELRKFRVSQDYYVYEIR